MPQTHKITELLQAWSKGDDQAFAELVPLVDHELRKTAHAYMKQERAGHILQTTALVAEALIRLMGQHKIAWQSRKHFFALVARRMRQVLVEYARGQLAAKRGNRVEHIDIADAVLMSAQESEELVLLHEALDKLSRLDERKAKTVEYRHFGGYNLEEIAKLLEVSQATVEREWRLARAWLRREICASVTQSS